MQAHNGSDLFILFKIGLKLTDSAYICLELWIKCVVFKGEEFNLTWLQIKARKHRNFNHVVNKNKGRDFKLWKMYLLYKLIYFPLSFYHEDQPEVHPNTYWTEVILLSFCINSCMMKLKRDKCIISLGSWITLLGIVTSDGVFSISLLLLFPSVLTCINCSL